MPLVTTGIVFKDLYTISLEIMTKRVVLPAWVPAAQSHVHMYGVNFSLITLNLCSLQCLRPLSVFRLVALCIAINIF